MRYLDVCSGISCASVAWHPLGWSPVGFSEIDQFAKSVLKHHYPHVPNFGDMRSFKDWPNVSVDVLVGGTPCQSFSVAGFRKGLDDPRGNLMLTYLAVARRYRPRWLVWENVAGVLSDKGNAFGTLLWAMGELGYGFAYRVLDSQFAGVPQRRRRVFVVGHLGDWRGPAAVLFERQGLRGDPPPSRKKGEEIAGTIEARSSAGGGLGDLEYSGGLQVAPTLTARYGKGADSDASDALIAHTLRGEGFDASEDGTGRGTPLVTIPFDTTKITHPQNRSNPQDGDPSPCLSSRAHDPAIAFSCKDYAQDASEISPTLRAMGHDKSHANAGGQVAIMQKTMIRRLTPRECERLMGLPDDYTLIDYRGKPAKDGPRYKAIGNGIVVPELRWIGGRIDKIDALMRAQSQAALPS